VMQVATWWIKSYIGLWLEAYSMLPHQGRMSYLVCAYVQDSKPHQDKVIFRLQWEYWGIWSIHKILVCGIPKEKSLNLLDIQIPNMRDARFKGRAPRAYVNCWEDHLFHGHQRSKTVLHYQPLKPNTYPPVVVVHKFFGWRPPWMTLESSLRKYHCYVIMRVQSS
jgi:hypothetical protein